MGTKSMHDRIKVALIYGSTREGRLCDAVATWAGERIWEQNEFLVDPVDPAALGLPTRHESEDGAAVTALQRRLDQADAFVVVTPEYNHSYPAALKFLIDSVKEPWYAKPVGFVSYGGIAGGLRAVEHLRLVFAELHAVTIRETVSFANIWSHLDDAGELRASEAAEQGMAKLTAQLHWWARALRDARAGTPYDQALNAPRSATARAAAG